MHAAKKAISLEIAQLLVAVKTTGTFASNVRKQAITHVIVRTNQLENRHVLNASNMDIMPTTVLLQEAQMPLSLASEPTTSETQHHKRHIRRP